MYGKIFSSMFEGSLYGNSDAIITMMLLIVLSDKEGNVDMTPQAISARTSIPLDTISKGIAFLEKPDPNSRTLDEEGRRLVRLDSHREWGWNIVNYIKYRELRSSEERREYWRQYKQKRRSGKSVGMSTLSTMSLNIPPIVEVEVKAEAEVEKITTLSSKLDSPSPNVKLKNEATEVLQFLNLKTGRAFRVNDTNLKLIVARLKSGASVQDCKTVIARKHREWGTNDKMWPYLRPATLFNATKFEQYIGECVTPDKEQRK